MSNETPMILMDIETLAELVEPDRRHVWLVAAPKTGSTWLNAILTSTLGWPTNALAIGGDRREQEIEICTMLPFLAGNLFSQHQHCRFSSVTADFINKFNVKVVLHGRNLFDSLVSFRDYTAEGFVEIPMAYIDEDFATLAPEQQLDFVIDLVTPWYLNFYGSWFMSKQRGEVDYVWSPYESLLEDTPKATQNVLMGVGEVRSAEQILASMELVSTMPTRLNVGRIGRGDKILTAEQKERVYRLMDYYPKIDFSSVLHKPEITA